MLCLITVGLTTFILSVLASNAVAHEVPIPHLRRTEGGIHLPIFTKTSSALRRRDGQRSAIGLGNVHDVAYNVMLTVGDTAMPILLDTGSADLWVMSDACVSNSNCSTSIPLYPQSSSGFQSTGLTADLFYGDSSTGTQASGIIGKDKVSLAGLSLPDQYFAAINNTNTTVLEAGSAGIFGLGFPIVSHVWSEIILANRSTSARGLKRHYENAPSNQPISNPAKRILSHNFKRPAFPSLAGLIPSKHQPRQQPPVASDPATIPSILQSYASTGPFLSRLAASRYLTAPMFTVTLQRDTVEIGGNAGLLSIGELPAGVSNDSLTWVPLRAYTQAQGGLVGPPDAPNEVYPMMWEIPIEDVLLDGQKLPPTTLSASNLSLSALIDTGNSLIRGPPDVIQEIEARLGPIFSCSTPHTLAFQIGGKLFPVDPRDFIRQANNDSVSMCVATLSPTDTPVEGDGFLFSWSLGDPFLKSVLSAYYFGNLSYPSQDPPRIGLLSTVPADADDKLRAAVTAASNNGNNFPATSEPPPTGVPTQTTTNTDATDAPTATPRKGDAARSTIPLVNSWFTVLVAGVVAGRGLV